MIIADMKLPYDLVGRLYIRYFKGHIEEVRTLEDLTYGAIAADILTYANLTKDKEEIYISYIIRS